MGVAGMFPMNILQRQDFRTAFSRCTLLSSSPEIAEVDAAVWDSALASPQGLPICVLSHKHL